MFWGVIWYVQQEVVKCDSASLIKLHILTLHFNKKQRIRKYITQYCRIYYLLTSKLEEDEMSLKIFKTLKIILYYSEVPNKRGSSYYCFGKMICLLTLC